MSTLKDKSITSTYEQLIKRQDTYSATGNQIEIMNANASSSLGTALYLDAANSRVGIGVSSPAELLHIQSTSGLVSLEIESTTHDAYLKLTSDTDEGQDSEILFQAGDNVRGSIEYDHHTSPASQKMNFKVGNNAITAVTMLGDGHVGIGTTAPKGTLQVLDASTTAYLQLQGASGAYGANINFWADAGEDATDGYSIGVTDTGVFRFRKSTDTAATSSGLGTWGTTVMTLDNDGYVGIGVASPNSLLQLNQAGNATIEAQYMMLNLNNRWGFQEGTSNEILEFARLHGSWQAIPMMAFDRTNGYIGIGTDSPASMLDIENNVDGDFVAIQLTNTHSTNDLDDSVSIVFSPDNAQLNSARIRVGKDEDYSTGANNSAHMAFHITKDNGSAERMRITSSGYVGIGRTDPAAPLEIASNSASGQNAICILRNNNTTANSEVGLLFRSQVGSTNTDFEINTVNISGNDADLVFMSDGRNERVRFTQDGKVGIGTAAPSSLLHIQADSTATTAPTEVLRLEVIDADTDLGIGEGPAIDFYVAEYDNISDWGARIACVRQNATDSQADAALSFWTGANDANATEKMRIAMNGHVGIGTTNPSMDLCVKAADGGQLSLETTDTALQDGDDLGHIYFQAHDSDLSSPPANGAIIRGEAAGNWDNSSSYDAPARLKFYTQNDGTGNGMGKPRMVITHGGLVGMNVEAPTSELEIESSGAGHNSISLWCANSSSGDPFIRFGGRADTNPPADADYDWGCGLDRDGNSFEIRYASGGVTEMSSASLFSMATDGTLTITAGTVTSDQRLKKDIADLSNPLATINALKGRTFKWIDETQPSGTQYGLIAQEVESVLPHLVIESTCKQLNPDGTLFKGDNLEDSMTVDEATAARNLSKTKTVNMSGVIPVLIEAIKELSAKVTALENA